MKEPIYLNFAVLVADENCLQCQKFKVVESENGMLHCKYLDICLNAMELKEGDKT